MNNSETKVNEESSLCSIVPRTAENTGHSEVNKPDSDSDMGGSPSCQVAAVDMKGPTAQMVKEQIRNNCVVIFSKTYCPYCKMAKKSFKDLGVPYIVYELDKERNGTEMQDVLDTMTGQRSVPRVFVSGKCIGGGRETQQLQKEGKLLEMVKQCLESS